MGGFTNPLMVSAAGAADMAKPAVEKRRKRVVVRRKRLRRRGGGGGGEVESG